MFQGSFAAVSVALVGGSVIERINFRTWLLFSTFWSIGVYPIIARWVWNDYGFLKKLGHIDFAGGTVVHVNSGISALVICLIVGKRKNLKKSEYKPSSIKLMILGTAILWFGWLGFNGGNGRDKTGRPGANFIATNAILITNIGACVGGLTWMLIEWWFSKEKKPTLIGIGSGVVSGLVGSTSLAGYVDFKWGIMIAFISGIIGYWGVIILKRMIDRYDDTLDVFGIHGLVGIWGAIATGLFTNPDIDETGLKGGLYGNWV
jgi:Amt family ammonium transporter